MLERIYLLFEIIAIIYCLFGLYGEKFRLDICTICLISIDIICLEIINDGMLSEKASILIYILIFDYTLLEFKSSIKRTVVNNLLYIVLVFLLQLLCSLPFTIFVPIISNTEILILAINISTLFVIWFLHKKIGLNNISDFVMSKEWLCIFLIIMYLLIVISAIGKYRAENILATDFYFLILAFVIMTILFMVKWQENRQKIMNQEIQLEMYQVYNGAFENLIHSVRNQQHEYNNQLMILESFLYSGANMEKIREMKQNYQDYLNSEMEYYQLLSINLPILGGFLYSKFSAWNCQGVRAVNHIHAEIKNLQVPLYEIIIILGIFLDNAYEAVVHYEQDKKVVHFNLCEDEEKYYFSVKNSCSYIPMEKVSQMFREGHSTKGDNRGIGLYNAKKKANRYGMNIRINQEEIEKENWISFTLEVTKENVEL